jgi:ElaB/YqjD/DUF883 family membrane-anchored ribosome-binding protein
MAMKKMKSFKRRMRINLMVLLTIFLTGSVMFSCNKAIKDSSNKNELAKEVQDVKEEINEILEQEKNELKHEIDSIVTNFNNEFYAFEKKIQKGTKKINAETEELIAKLKKESNNLSERVKEIQNQSNENWEEFKNELQHDTKNFSEAVEDFFEDNK